MKLLHSLCVAGCLFTISTIGFAAGDHAGGHHEQSEIGQPGSNKKVSRTIRLEASDNMKFSLNDIKVKHGKTIKFIITNMGKLKHEFSLGTEKELKEHYEVMKKFPDMEHDEPSKITLAPGQSGEVIWKFSKTGIVHFACLHPGHFDAGMKGIIQVKK